MSPLLNPSSSQLKSRGATALRIPRPALLKTLRLSMRLTSFSPTSGYPGLNLHRYVYLIRAVQNGVHAFDHRPFQPSLCVRCPFYLALDSHLVVADKYRHGPWALIPTLPQQGQRQFQTIGSGSLDRRVKAVG